MAALPSLYRKSLCALLQWYLTRYCLNDSSLSIYLSRYQRNTSLLPACVHRLRQHGEDPGDQVDLLLKLAVQFSCESVVLGAGGVLAHDGRVSGWVSEQVGD